MNRPPPANLSTLDPLLYTIPAGSEFWLHAHKLRYIPPHFGTRATNRFDDPLQIYGTFYLAETHECVFLETIGRKYIRLRHIPWADVAESGFTRIRFRRDVRLVDIASPRGLTRIGAEGSITGGLSYKTAQKWSRALYEHPCAPDGIRYFARHDQSQIACVLFGDRAEDAIEAVGPAQPWLADRLLLARILDGHRFSLLP